MALTAASALLMAAGDFHQSRDKALSLASPPTAVGPAGSSIAAKRAMAWAEILRIAARPTDMLQVWYPVDDVFGLPRGRTRHGSEAAFIRRGRAKQTDIQSGEAEAITSTLYNDVAAGHVSVNRLHSATQLRALLRTGPADRQVPGNQSVPPFPEGSAIVLATWWPARADAATPVPVWDPDLNPANAAGNGYANWKRMVAASVPGKEPPQKLDFLGNAVPVAKGVSRDKFWNVNIKSDAAKTLMADPQARKAALIALGRPLRSGDYLLLVGMHVMVKHATGWHWITLWWHDEPDRSPFAAGRPANMGAPWRNYLLDAVSESSGSAAYARPVFNPWLEGRFASEGGHGGLSSNCVNCHGRASYPPTSFLPVRTGAPDHAGDPAYARDRVRTDFVWGMARRAIQ